MWGRIRNIALMAGLVSLFGYHGAYAIVTPVETTWDFSGLCGDCTGTATATLVLDGYTPGNPLSNSNFVSFTYDGTDLVSGFTVSAADLPSLAGSLPVPDGSLDLEFPNAGIVSKSQDAITFFQVHSDIDGSWALGNNNGNSTGPGGGGPLGDNSSDQGTGGVITAAAVPEPASLTLLGAALIGLGAARRRRKDARPA